MILIAQGLLVAGCAVTTDDRTLRPPVINLSASAAVKYAFGEGCLPAVVEGRPVGDFLRAAPLLPKSPGVTEISTAVRVRESAIGCTVEATAPDTEALRTAVLDRFEGVALRPIATRGPGPYQQEAYCLVLAGKPAQLVISTRQGSPSRMVATFAVAKDGPCLAPAPR
jgi:hypothetical protein